MNRAPDALTRRLGTRLRAGLRIVLACAFAVWTASCGSPAPQFPAGAPALWEVSGPGERKAWLFGTIHALPDDAQWFTARLDTVLDQTGVLVVEVADLADRGAGARAFAALASTSGLPPLLQRVPAAQRPAIAAALGRAGMAEADFRSTET